MRFVRARSLILSPSNKSIARQALPPRPALKSLSGSGSLAPWEKGSFTLSLWALPPAIIPSRDHTGLPIHFHSSIISRSASRMLLRIVASVLPRQSVSFAISASICSDGFIGILYVSNSYRVFVPKACTLTARVGAFRHCYQVLSRLARLSVSINAELFCVLCVQTLPAAELHGLGADDASDRLAREESLEDVEADMPARGAPRDEAAID